MSWIFLHLSARMRMLKPFSSVFCTLVAMVLFSLTISMAMASPKDCPDGLEHFISKKGTASTNSDNQLPYEEKETEKDNELQDNFSLVCLISEPVVLLPIRDQDNGCEKTLKPIDAITDIPLYLSKRVFLI
jgi:hypothetical protein